MVEDIYNIKNQIIRRIESDISERGPERIDVAEMGKLVDMVKDLAEAEKSCWEAEYYKGVSEAMESNGYSDSTMGYSRSGSMSNGYRMGYRNSGRGSANQYGNSRGYSMGYSDSMDALRVAMQNADPQERERMKREMQQLLNGSM